MPAIYMSFAFEPDDTVEQRMSKLYLGIISTGEQLYTYNAAITELRKVAAQHDKDLARMREQYEALKLQVHGTNSAKQIDGAKLVENDFARATLTAVKSGIPYRSTAECPECYAEFGSLTCVRPAHAAEKQFPAAVCRPKDGFHDDDFTELLGTGELQHTQRFRAMSGTEVLDCGCVVMKGWRCPAHSAP